MRRLAAPCVATIGLLGACVDWSLLPSSPPVPVDVPQAQDWTDLGVITDLRSVSGSAGRVFTTATNDTSRSLGEIAAPDVNSAIGVDCGGLTKVGPVHVDDAGTLYVGLEGGVGRVDTVGRTCAVFDDGIPDVANDDRTQPPCTGLPIASGGVAIWNGTALLITADVGATPVSVPLAVPGDVPHDAALSRSGDVVHVVLQQPLFEFGTFAAVAFDVDVTTGTAGPARAGVGAVVNGEDVTVAIEAGQGVQSRTIAIGFGAAEPVAVPVFSGGIAEGDGDRAFFVVADDVGGRVLVGGPAGLLIEATPSAAVLLSGPRLPTIVEFVQGRDGEVWGIGLNAILFWTKLSADTGLPPDAVVELDVADTVGAVAIAPRQLVVRGVEGLSLVDTSSSPPTTSALSEGGDGSARGAIGLGGGQLVEATGGGERIFLTRLVLDPADPLRVLRVDGGIPVNDDEATPCSDPGCAVVASAVAPDGSAVVVVRRADAQLVVKRCPLDLATTPPTVLACAQLGTMEAAGAEAFQIHARHGDAEVIVTRPGLVALHTTGEGFRTFEAAFASESARRVGNCLVTSGSQRLVIIDPGSATPRDVELDGAPRAFIGVGETATDGILVGGGSETRRGVPSAAQLYRVALGDACLPGTVATVGLVRAQADLIGGAVRADGAIYVGDAVQHLWRVR